MASLKLLLDTVGLLCAAVEPERMSAKVVDLVAAEENQIFVSAASAWELSTKFRLGELDLAEELVRNWGAVCERLRFDELVISAAHALRSGNYDVEHRDPFDRMICAQGELEEITIVTNDAAFELFPVQTIW